MFDFSGKDLSHYSPYSIRCSQFLDINPSNKDSSKRRSKEQCCSQVYEMSLRAHILVSTIPRSTHGLLCLGLIYFENPDSVVPNC